MNTLLTINEKRLMKCLFVSFLCFTLICSSCARRYYELEPEKISYVNTEEKNGLTFSYQYSELKYKYRNKESRKELKLIAVKCTNHSGRDLVFGTDIQLMREKGRTADLAGESYIYHQLRQRPASHLFWMLLTALTVRFVEGSSGYNQTTTTIPVGLVLGPAFTITNISTAINANHAFKNDLKQHNLLGRIIPNGETVYGLAGVRTYRYEKLSLKDSIGN